MTRGSKEVKGAGMIFANPDEVRVAFDAGKVDLHAEITVRMGTSRHTTTGGRILLWEIIPKENILVLRHIMTATEETAKDIQAQIQSGHPFGDLVKKSESPDKENGGHIGLLRRDEFIRIFNVSTVSPIRFIP
jgi:DNA-directed RNA polymerase subunit beta'